MGKKILLSSVLGLLTCCTVFWFVSVSSLDPAESKIPATTTVTPNLHPSDTQQQLPTVSTDRVSEPESADREKGIALEAFPYGDTEAFLRQHIDAAMQGDAEAQFALFTVFQECNGGFRDTVTEEATARRISDRSAAEAHLSQHHRCKNMWDAYAEVVDLSTPQRRLSDEYMRWIAEAARNGHPTARLNVRTGIIFKVVPSINAFEIAETEQALRLKVLQRGGYYDLLEVASSYADLISQGDNTPRGDNPQQGTLAFAYMYLACEKNPRCDAPAWQRNWERDHSIHAAAALQKNIASLKECQRTGIWTNRCAPDMATLPERKTP